VIGWRFVISTYTPMAPTLIREPFHRAGWVCEEKIDGWRMLAYKDGFRVLVKQRWVLRERPRGPGGDGKGGRGGTVSGLLC